MEAFMAEAGSGNFYVNVRLGCRLLPLLLRFA